MDSSATDIDKAAVRATVFTHLAGLVVAPTVSALWERGAFELFLSASDAVSFDEIVGCTHANPGYLRVALRLLASCGWVTERTSANAPWAYALTREGRNAMTLAPALYGELTSFFLPKALLLDDYVFGPSDEVFQHAEKENFDAHEPDRIIVTHSVPH